MSYKGSSYRGQTAYPRTVTRKQHQEAFEKQMKEYQEAEYGKYFDSEDVTTKHSHFAR